MNKRNYDDLQLNWNHGAMKCYLYFVKFIIAYAFFVPNVNASTTATSSDSLTVTTTVLDSCTISANSFNFGNYSNASVTATTFIAVVCTNTTPYQVGLNSGTGSGASVTTRKMTNGANLLNYSLYQNAAFTTVWGNTQGSNTVSSTGNGVTQNLTVYGKITSGQTPPMGTYTDTITVTVYF